MEAVIEKLMNYKFKNNSKISVRKTAVKGIAGFFALMLVFTFLSRAANAMTLARVTTDTVQKRTLDHSVTKQGTILENGKQAIYTVSGLKIKSVNVNIGDSVIQGDTLMELETDDLGEKITELKNTITLLELELETLQHNASISDSETAKDLARAKEDYESAVSQGNTAVTRAYETMIRAKEDLENFKNSRSAAQGSNNDAVYKTLESACTQCKKQLNTAETDLEKLKTELEDAIAEAQDNAQINSQSPLSNRELKAIEKQTQEAYQKKLEKAEQAVSNAENALAKAEAAMAEYQSAQTENTNADLDNQETELQSAYKSAIEAYEDAVLSMNNAVETAGRSIEDSSAPGTLTTEEEMKKAEIDSKYKELKKLKILDGNGGLVTAPSDGVVTDVTAATGMFTEESEAFLLADTSKGMRFTASITKDEQKYISKGDTAVLTLNNDTILEGLEISSIVQNAQDGEMMDVTILLDYNENISFGESAEVKVNKASKSYSTCVPLQALNQDNATYYVLAIKEKQSILGTIIEVERIDVTLQVKNTSYAALTDGALTGDTKVVIDSNKTLQPGDRVRLTEE